jgi:hypothetical protein
MKKLVVIALALASAYGAFAQGTVRNVNNVTGFLVAKVYGVDPTAPTVAQHGNVATGLPAGSVTYGGAALAGTGFTIQLWGIGGVVTDATTLLLANSGASTFRTGGAAGIWTETAAAIQNAPGGAGSHATAEVRVWDNKGGTITTWNAALAAWQAGTTAMGRSGLFDIANLGDGGSQTPPLLDNLRSFNLTQVPVPEPSTIAFALMGGLGLLAIRRRK